MNKTKQYSNKKINHQPYYKYRNKQNINITYYKQNRTTID